MRLIWLMGLLGFLLRLFQNLNHPKTLCRQRKIKPEQPFLKLPFSKAFKEFRDHQRLTTFAHLPLHLGSLFLWNSLTGCADQATVPATEVAIAEIPVSSVPVVHKDVQAKSQTQSAS